MQINKMINYKGLFYKQDSKNPNYEGGAHFQYKELVKALEIIKAKREEEKNEKKNKSRNKSVDYDQEKEKENLSKISNKATIHSNKNYVFESPKNEDKNNNDYIEQLISLDKLKLSKKRKIKLKEIKSENKKKEMVLYTENNRYINEDDYKQRYKSLDLNPTNKINNHKYELLLTEDKYNFKINDQNKRNIFNLKLLSDSNIKSYKNIGEYNSLPKIESLYFHNLSKKNIAENSSNLNIATNNSNKKSEFIEPKIKMEYEIYKNLNKPEFLIFSNKKKLPQINWQSMSIINNNNNKNNILDKNRALFNVNKNKKEELSLSNDVKDTNKYEKENTILRTIHLKKNNHRLLKLGNLDKANNDKIKDLKSKLFKDKDKKVFNKK